VRPEIRGEEYYPGKFMTEAVNSRTSRAFRPKRLAVAASPWVVYLAISGYLGPAALPACIFTGFCSGMAAEVYDKGILSAAAINFGAYLAQLFILSIFTSHAAGDAGLGFAIVAIIMLACVPAAALGAAIGRLARVMLKQ
jgi:hypothetical protein